MNSAHASHAPALAEGPNSDSAPRLDAARDARDDSPATFTDAERYAWIRSNRGNFLIFEALSRANFDKDFDALIDMAMRNHRRGRHVPAMPLISAPRRRRSDWE